MQVEKAQALWSFDNDEGERASLVPVKLPSGDVFGATSQTPTPTGKAKAAAKKATAKSNGRRAGNTQNPMVYAATQRAKTAKQFIETEKLLEKALKSADALVDVTAPKLLGDTVDVREDASLHLVRSRRALVEAAMDPSGSPTESSKACLNLFQLSLQDPYLKDCRDTILSSEAFCQTLGFINYARKVTLDLQLGAKAPHPWTVHI